MMTNVELTEHGSEHYWGYHSNDFEGEFKILKDIRYCPDAGAFNAYRVYGTLISADDFKGEIEAHIASSDDYDSVLFNIHGFNVDPENSFMGVYNYMHGNGAGSKILGIPISWRNHWGKTAASYDYDRNTSAPQAGRELAAKFSAFQINAPSSIMCHSMGNYVFRVMAQNIELHSVAFDNAYMVAADARMDMFGTDFNPAAPRTAGGTGAPAAQTYLAIPDSELRENGGYDITQIATHVHVVWNRGDHALMIREAFQVGWGANVRKALGKFGDLAEEYVTLPYFQERVTFHDFSAIIEEFGIEHGYQFSDAVAELYAEHKAEDVVDLKME